jgi:transcriptional regulator with XRE-family HTH domain
MMEKNNINQNALSDNILLHTIGQFIQDTRLQQNKTQLQIAIAAGIDRSTLSQVEKGHGGTILTLIQILRALDQLPVLKAFEVERKISPIQLAKLEQSKRRRARNTDKPNGRPDLKSSW